MARWFRDVLVRCTDADVDRLVCALDADDVQRVICRTARFNWHHDLIVALARQAGVASLLVKSLLR